MRPLILLLLAGSAAPVAAADIQRKYFYEDIHAPFFVKDERAGLYRPQRAGASAEPFPIRKAPGTLRVFVLGGSIAGRYMEGRNSLGPILRELLPGRPIEAVNCGMAGYDSHREALVLEEVLDYEPDLLVLLSGHNETDQAPPPLWLVHAQDRASRLKLFQDFLHRSTASARPPEDLSDRTESVDARFEENLRRMARRCADRGIPLVLAGPPLNRREAPTRLPLPLARREVIDGWLLGLKGEHVRAAESLTSGLERLPRNDPEQGRPWALFLLARSLERQGRLEEAARRYQEALDADRVPAGRCLSGCQAAIRKIALEEGATWIDLDGEFQRAAAPWAPGFEMFNDTVHWTRAHDLLASLAIIEGMRRLGRFQTLGWDARRLETLWPRARRPGAAVDDEEALATVRYARREIEISMRGLSGRAMVYLESLLEARPLWFRDPAALAKRAGTGSAKKGAAWGMAPLSEDPAPLLLHAAGARLMRGEASAALRDAERALALRPGLPRAQLLRGIALWYQDRRDAALEPIAAEGAGTPGIEEEKRALADAIQALH